MGLGGRAPSIMGERAAIDGPKHLKQGRRPCELTPHGCAPKPAKSFTGLYSEISFYLSIHFYIVQVCLVETICVHNLPCLCLGPQLPVSQELGRHLGPFEMGLFKRQCPICGRCTARKHPLAAHPPGQVEIVFSWDVASDETGLGEHSRDVVKDERTNSCPSFRGLDIVKFLHFFGSGSIVEAGEKAVELLLLDVEVCKLGRSGSRELLESVFAYE